MGRALFALASARKSSFSFASRSGSLVGEVVGLGEVSRQVVKLPDVVVRVPSLESGGRARSIPRYEWPKRAGEPAIVVDTATGVVLEVLGLLPTRSVRVGKTVCHAHAIHRVLLDPVHLVRGLDADRLVESRDDVVDVVELVPGCLVRLDPLGPRDDHRVASPAKVCGNKLRRFERRAACPGPARVVHVVDLGPPRAGSPPSSFIAAICCSIVFATLF